MSYSFPNFEPVYYSMFSSNYCFFTCIQVSQEAGKFVWYSYLFKNSLICCDPHKGFSVVNETEVDVFLEFSCFFYDPTDVDSFISGSSTFSKSSLYIWNFSVYILLKPSLEDFEHVLVRMCNCVVVCTFLWHCLSLGLE